MKDKDNELIWESQFGQYASHADHEKAVNQGTDVPHSGTADSYMHYLKDLSQHASMEDVLSHPFEETYGDYLRTKGVAGPYKAAIAHKALAEKMGVYHEVDTGALDNWKYS